MQQYPFLWNHQQECLELADQYNRYAFYLDLGTGKTILSLAIISEKIKNSGKALIVTKQSLVRANFIRECNTYFPHLSFVDLCGSMSEVIGKRWLLNAANVFFINFEQFRACWDYICKDITVFCIDESGVLRNNESGITNACFDADDKYQFPWLYLFSGLPSPNNETEYFSQMRLIDDKIFGRDFNTFFSTNFRRKKGTLFLKDKEGFLEKLRKKSIYISKEDIKSDVPEKIHLERYFKLDGQQKDFYEAVLNNTKNGLFNTGNVLQVKNIQTIKLQEIICGFLKNSDETIYTFDTKLYDTLIDVLDEIRGKQAIIWCTLDYEQASIVNRLIEEKKDIAFVHGKHSNKERLRAIDSFKNGGVQYLVSKPSILKYGHNLECSHYSIYTSHTYSNDDYSQSQDRIHRLTQNERCVYVSLLAENSVSEIIYSALRQKKDVAQSVLDWLKVAA